MEVVITKSKNSSKKKYDARIDGTKTVSFGQNFILHKQSIYIYKPIFRSSTKVWNSIK